MSRARGTGRNGSSGPDVVLIVGAARSGTTLLRLLLDAHTEIGSPAEAGIPALIQHLAQVWRTIDADRVPKGREDPQSVRETLAPSDEGQPGDEISPHLTLKAKAEIRRAVLAPMRQYCQRHDKRICCDKSLDSVHYLEAVRQVFPNTRYLLLFRHVMDTVASGMEASPWGFQAYGYFPFVQRTPDNFVAALVDYWLTHVDKALRWQKVHPKLCHRVRYEDLVNAPRDTVDGICRFLGVDSDSSSVMRTAFEKARVADGPGDYKVKFTSSVTQASIGHGKRIPVGMIPPPLLESVNEKLTALGYEPLTKAWNAEPLARPGGPGSWGLRLAEIMRRANVPCVGSHTDSGSFAVVAEDAEDLRWVIDPTLGVTRQGDGDVENVITGTAEDLVLMLSGEINPGVLIRSGRIRHLTAREDVLLEDVVRTINSILETLLGGAGVNGDPPEIAAR